MKKKISVVVCLVVFAALAAGSGSKKDSESSRTSVTVEAENDKKSENTEKTESDKSTDETKTDNSKKEDDKKNDSDTVQYDVTDTRFDYYENSIGSTEYYGIVEITNTGNCDIYMDNCTFDLEDNDGHLLQSDDFISSCPEVVAPGEKGYFYNGLGSNLIDSGVSMENGVKLAPQIKISKAKDKPHTYPVSDVSVTADDMWGIKITGRVENDTQEDVSYLGITIIFYDADGKVLSIDGTTVSDIGAGNKGSFDTSTAFSNGNISIDDIAETKVIAEDTYYQF